MVLYLIRTITIAAFSVFPIILLGQQPGTLTIKGRIITTHYAKPSKEKDICNKYPCIATVKVLQVLEQGSGLIKPLSVGDTIRLQFAYSLKKTNKKYFPKLKEQLPGLSKGQVFTGMVNENKMLGDSVSYGISTYKRIKK